MNYLNQLLGDVQDQIRPTDEGLRVGRERRDLALRIARGVGGVLRSYTSGSLRTGMVNNPVNDADCGIVLDRRSYPELGPEGGCESPAGPVAELHQLLGPELRERYPDAIVRDMKRGVTVCFNAPLADRQDPRVDLVVALTRCEGSGLWIPNLKAGRWDPAHPERHVELLTAGDRGTRRARARAARMAKAWNEQFAEPGLSSFNICVLAWEAVTSPMNDGDALVALFEHAANALAEGLTNDPAGVSAPPKLEVARDVVVSRLQVARDALAAAARYADDPVKCQEALASVFWDYLNMAAPMTSTAAIADQLRTTTPRLRTTAAGVVAVGTLGASRAWSDLHG